MTSTKYADLDPVKELRLRRWALQNYVPLEQRDATWHAIVLDEMHRRDVETGLAADQQARRALVPLAPHTTHRQSAQGSTSGLLFRIDPAESSATENS